MNPRRHVRLAALLVAASVASTAFAKVFVKGAHQYCVSRLSAAEQSKYYSRIVNLGASYSHGCTSCDISPKIRQELDATGDLGWVRRNFLVQFLQTTKWKHPTEFSHEAVSVVENDPSTNFATLWDKKTLRRTPYTGRWLYTLASADLRPTTRNLVEQIGGPDFRDEAYLVGGAMPRTGHRRTPNANSNLGTIFQTLPGTTGGNSKTIIDFAADSAYSYSIMQHIGDAKLYKDLMRHGWRDPVKRSRLIQLTANHLLATRPTIVYAVDAMAWDAIQHMFHLISLHQPRDPLLRFFSSDIWESIVNRKFRGYEAEARIRNDFFAVLAQVSLGTKETGSVPVLLARLIESPAIYAVNTGMHRSLAFLIGSYIKNSTRLDLTPELLDTMNQLDVDTIAAEPQPRPHIPIWERLTGPWRRHIAQPMPPTIQRIVASFLREMPLILHAADEAFNYQNAQIRRFTAQTDHNVHLINADKFYQNFDRVVHPQTLHPTVAGARWISQLFDEAVCNSSEEL